MSYLLNTPDDQRRMLERIGATSLAALFDSIPAEVRLNRPLQIPAALSELELTQHMTRLAQANLAGDRAVCFLGGGSYDHFIPAVVDALAGRSEFYTAYTPYQAEASQGSLQAFFEFQTMICQLTGLEVSNASLYEGGSGVAEAAIMALNLTSKRSKILIAESVHPEYRLALATYLANLNVQFVAVPQRDGGVDPDEVRSLLDDQTACLIVQHPNFFGCLEEVEALSAAAHEKGALFIVSYDPISLGLLKRPGQYHADIAVAEGQCLGNTMTYGGPYLGLLSCREDYVRKMPGRLVGQTTDRKGQRCWVLTLQTREQHIRREKATSNICTNQGLMALKATIYLAALGPEGLKETAELCLQKAHYAAEQLSQIDGMQLKFNKAFFKEFTVEIGGKVADLLSRTLHDGYHAGLALERWYPSLKKCLTLAVTEKRTKNEIDGLVDAVRRGLMPTAESGDRESERKRPVARSH